MRVVVALERPFVINGITEVRPGATDPVSVATPVFVRLNHSSSV